MSEACRRTLRVAVLVCFTIPPRISAARGQFDKLFDTWLQHALHFWNEKRPLGERWDIDIAGYDVVDDQQYPDISSIDALIVTGSTASAYDKDPWIRRLEIYLQDVYLNHEHIRIFGGCFGHQIVAQALLGQHSVAVEKSPRGWEIGVHRIEVTPEFSSHFPGLLGDRLLSFQFLHADHVIITNRESLPGRWVLVGATDLCDVQGFMDPGRVLIFQGHPEFDEFINGESTSSLAASGRFTKEELEAHLLEINQADQAVLAGQVVIKFLMRDLS